MNDAAQQRPIADRQIADAESKLSLLLKEVKGSPVEPRVQLWIQRMAGGRKLSDYLQDDKVSAKDRLTVARSLVDVLLTKEYARLPELPAAEPKSVTEALADEPTPEPEIPAPDELREIIRSEIRSELARTFEIIAAAIRQSK